MRTKIEAGKIATTAGTHMVIAAGRVEHPLAAIADGGRCTWFLTPANPVTARKKWIAGSLEPTRHHAYRRRRGRRRCARGKSLLPAGVMRIEGAFARGDASSSAAPNGAEIGRGLVAYDADDAAQDHRPLVARHRCHARASRPRRDDPPRRYGARAASLNLRSPLSLNLQ